MGDKVDQSQQDDGYADQQAERVRHEDLPESALLCVALVIPGALGAPGMGRSEAQFQNYTAGFITRCGTKWGLGLLGEYRGGFPPLETLWCRRVPLLGASAGD